MPADTQARRGARVIFIPPPLYYAAGLAGGAAIDRVAALPLGGRPATAAAGLVVTGLAIAYLGVTPQLGSWWPLMLWPLVIVAVRRLVIRPEEWYLTERFGQTYTDYQSQVRRWL